MIGTPTQAVALVAQELHSLDDQQPQQKRRRLSSPPHPPCSLASAAPTHPSGPVGFDEESDGCQTPPRGSETSPFENAPLPGASAAGEAQEDDGAQLRSWTPSASPAPTTHSHDGVDGDQTQVVVFVGEKAEKDQTGSPHQAPDGQGSSTHTTSLPHANVASAGTLQDASELQMPKFGQLGKGKRWPRECEVGFLRFIAHNPELRSYAVSGVRGARGVEEESLKRFSVSAQGPQPSALRSKLRDWREKYGLFKHGLSTVGCSTHTDTWTNTADLAWLEVHKASEANHWIFLWHELVVNSQQDDYNSSTASSRLHSAPPQTPFQATASSSTQAAATVGSKSSRVGRPIKHKYSPSKSRSPKMDPDAQLEENARQIKHLQEQSERQAQLLATQEQLLQRVAQGVDTQTQTLAQQQQTLSLITQQLDSLHALMRERM